MPESPPSKLLWGIDGGGTKTTILLAEQLPDRPPTILASVRAGSSNVNSRPWGDITSELFAAMQSALNSAALPNRPTDALVAAFAGVGSPIVRNQWREWFSSRNLANQVEIVDDGAPLIAAGLPDGWGIVLIAGTGSAAFGRSPTGELARAGGWGYLIGDEGSAFTIGQAALRAMSIAYDRGEPLSPTLQAIAKKWSIEKPRDIVDRVYPTSEPRQRIAELAPLVDIAAENGDPLAQDILNNAADKLAELVGIVANRLGFSDKEFPLALSGGVAANSSLIREKLAVSLTNKNLLAKPITVVVEPAYGCLKLAQQIDSP